MRRLLAAAAIAGAVAATLAAPCPPFSAADESGACTLCDCDGACFSAHSLAGWPADGTCNVAAPNLACWAFEQDGGDCPEAGAPPPDAVISENAFRGDGAVAVDASEMGG